MSARVALSALCLAHGLVTGVVRKVDRAGATLEVGGSKAVLVRAEMLPQDELRVGDTVEAWATDAATRGSPMLLSRRAPELVGALFQEHVPELAAGKLVVKGVVREPGKRAKIAVQSLDSEVDPVRALVGKGLARVMAVTNALGGERIDIIPWSPEAP